MNLPVLTNTSLRVDDASIVRMACKLELDDARGLGEETVLDAGIAVASRALARVHDANRIFDASLVPGTGAEALVQSVDQFFETQGLTCFKWALNPSAPEEYTGPLSDYLLSRGYIRTSADVMRLESARRDVTPGLPGAKIIPARASFRHARALAEFGCASDGRDPELAEAQMARLDNPQYEQFLLLHEGEALGCAGVLSGGEACLIDNVFVLPSARRQGVASRLMARVIDHCARSLFKHVLLIVRPDNIPARALYHGLGFRKAGESVEYAAPLLG